MKARSVILGLLFISFNTSEVSAFPTPLIYSKETYKPLKKADEVFRNFFLHRQQNEVVLSWGVLTSNVNDFIIQKSYDGEYFDDVNGTVTTIGRWNRFTDNEVFPGYIHYRIIAILNDGSFCYSSVQVIRIVRKK